MEQALTVIAVLTPILTFLLTIIELVLALRRLLNDKRKKNDLEGILLPWMATRVHAALPTAKHPVNLAEQYTRLAPWLLGFVNLVLGPTALAVSLFLSTGSRSGDILVTLTLFAFWLLANGLVLVGLIVSRRMQFGGRQRSRRTP